MVECIVQAVNLGMDGNFSFIYEAADTKDVWTLSNDDLLVDGAVGVVVNLLISRPGVRYTSAMFGMTPAVQESMWTPLYLGRKPK